MTLTSTTSPAGNGVTVNGPWGEGSLVEAAAHARAMFSVLGIDCDTASTERTPDRFVKALAEMTAGLHLDPTRHLRVQFPPESVNQGIIAAVDIPFVALCEHHVLPFLGRATVAYLPAPGGRIVGLSKLARVVQEYGARPQVQERLGEQVVAALSNHLAARGAACLIRSDHACLTLRGAEAHGAVMVTTHLSGEFTTDSGLRAQVLELAPAYIRR
jgi:GTP cyclohydrolase I